MFFFSSIILSIFFVQSNSPYVKIDNLLPGKTYKFIASIFNRNAKVRRLNEIAFISTFSMDYQPKAVQNITISNYSRENNTLGADLSWILPENGNPDMHIHLCFDVLSIINNILFTFS